MVKKILVAVLIIEVLQASTHTGAFDVDDIIGAKLAYQHKDMLKKAIKMLEKKFNESKK